MLSHFKFSHTCSSQMHSQAFIARLSTEISLYPAESAFFCQKWGSISALCSGSFLSCSHCGDITFPEGFTPTNEQIRLNCSRSRPDTQLSCCLHKDDRSSWACALLYPEGPLPPPGVNCINDTSSMLLTSASLDQCAGLAVGCWGFVLNVKMSVIS